MGDDEGKWGKPKLFLDDGTELVLTKTPVSALAEVENFNSEAELASHYIGIPKEGMQYDFSVRLSHASYKRMMYRCAIEEAYRLAKTLNNFIRDCMIGSRLPRKKKKWCKKNLSRSISNYTGVPKNKILRHFKVKKT